jgi:hypothetical protein
MEPWENSLMKTDEFMGSPGSITVLILCIAVTLLLRSFYKRFNKMKDRENSGEN